MRYKLSFSAGSLFLAESVRIAQLYQDAADWDAVRRIVHEENAIQKVRSGLNFDYEWDTGNTMHARSIVTDTGWKISLDRGLDIFQPYDWRNAFDLANTVQTERQCKAFEVTYLKMN